MSVDLDALEKLNAARTQGEWYRESDDEGDGRYQASFLHASDLRRDYDILADSINSTASVIEDESDCDGVHRWDSVARANFDFIAAAANGMSELIRLARIGQRAEQDINAITRDGMRDAWNEICADSGHHPRDITHGRGSELWFEPSTWADWTAAYIQRALGED